MERKSTPNIHSMLSEEARALRTDLLNKLIAVNRPVYPEEITLKENFDLTESLQELKEKGLIVLQEDGAITGLYPVSALKTPHKVQLEDGRSFYAMCAIDALGAVYEFGQDLKISSSCKRCNTLISIASEETRFVSVRPPTAHALHVAIEKYRNWAASC